MTQIGLSHICSDRLFQMYILLDSWPYEKVETETAMELLDVRYPDPYVRQFAVKCLEANLSDDQLCLYLVSLVQVCLLSHLT